MYSWEIDQLMKLRNYLIESEEYYKILITSPQINHVKHTPENGNFLIETDDNYKVNFKVYRKEKKD